MTQNTDIKKEAQNFFAKFKKTEHEFIRLSKLREEKLGVLGYISYAALFIGVMALVALKMNGYEGALFYYLFGFAVAAAALYILIGQVFIGIYEKKSRKKRDSEFNEIRARYNKLLLKKDYYFTLRSCGYDVDECNRILKERDAAEKLKKTAENQKRTVVKKRFNDSVCAYCRNGICNFEADETVYSFKCEPENCRWKSDKKL